MVLKCDLVSGGVSFVDTLAVIYLVLCMNVVLLREYHLVLSGASCPECVNRASDTTSGRHFAGI